MLILNIILGVYVLFSLWYFRKLYKIIRVHESAWTQIEMLTDSGQDGTVVIHVKHNQ